MNIRQPPPQTREEANPFALLHREVNRLFDDAFRNFALPGVTFGKSWPSVEISDKEKEIRVTAEVPGMDEKDIEVLLDGEVLTLRGEKRSETEDKDRQFSERIYGRFERRIPLGSEVESDKVKASFDKGVLNVVLPKVKQVQAKSKRIAIGGK